MPKTRIIPERTETQIRCECVRCGKAAWLWPDEVGALHYTQRGGYVCGAGGRFLPRDKEVR